MIGRSLVNFCSAHGISLGGFVKENHEESKSNKSSSVC